MHCIEFFLERRNMENINNEIEFFVLGSSSSGNCYIFRKHNECVMVECGFEYPKLVEKMYNNNIDPQTIKSVIVTHCHNDHCLSLDYFARYGCEVFCPKTCENKLTNPQMSNIHYITDDDNFQLANWLKVKCFATMHDTESYGFAFLDTETKQSILFINDTKCFDFKYKAAPYDIVFIECNHIRKQLEVVMQVALDKGENGRVFKYQRQAGYHMSLAACKKFLRLMNTSKTKVIFLMHLSQELCNQTIVKAEIKETFGIPTYVCQREGGLF